MLVSHSQLGLLALLLVPATAFATPGDVWVVDSGGTADFVDLPAAVSAASDGDSILVLPGNYSGFAIDGKSLSITGDLVPFVQVEGTVRVRNLAAGMDVHLASLALQSGIRANDCDGHLGFSDCLLEPEGLNTDPHAPISGSHRVVSCADVVFSRCALNGGDGGIYYSCQDLADAAPGEAALYVDDSRVALYSCELQGGAGGDANDGACGWSTICLVGSAGAGGAGLLATNQSFVYADDSILAGGAGGQFDTECGSGESQPAGAPVELNSSQLQVAQDPVLKLASPTVVRSDELLSVSVTGPPGATALLLWSAMPDWRPFGGAIGLLNVDGQSLNLLALGTIPASGQLEATVTPPPVPIGEDARHLYVQAFALESTVGRMLGTSSGLVVLDPAF